MPNAFVHLELNTDDVAKAKKFYKGLFKWKFADVGGGYTMIDVGETTHGAGGGMTKKPMPKMPTMWLPYIEVDNVKKATAKAQKLGANVQVDYMEIGDMGAIGVFLDPTGAPIGVWEKAKKASKKKSAKKAAKKSSKKKAR